MGPGSIDNIIRAIAPQAETPKYIRAYHGSPYDFDRFDASHLGRGEGHQAYGHGLYFAGNENVARYYRDTLSERRDRIVKGTNYEIPNWVASRIEAGEDVAGVREEFAKRLRDALADARRPDARQPWLARGQARRHVDLLRGLDAVASGAEIAPAGRMYEVEIRQPQRGMLDWDADIDNQPLVVQEALRRIGLPLGDATGPTLHSAYGWTQPALVKGSDVYKTARNQLGRVNDLPYKDLEPYVAAWWRDQGVPGVRYLDAGSRHLHDSAAKRVAALQKDRAFALQMLRDPPEYLAGNFNAAEWQNRARDAEEAIDNIEQGGELSRNFVAFPGTEDSIRILRKYGMMAPIAAGAGQEQR